jgi:hypothetical protein
MEINQVKSIFKRLGFVCTIDGEKFIDFDNNIKIIFSFNDERNQSDHLYIYYGEERFLEGCYQISDLNVIQLLNIVCNYFIFNKLSNDLIREIKLEYLLDGEKKY